jgi:hypothetical protein
MTSTDVATTSSGTVATPDEEVYSSGLEDIERSDMRIPRIRIIHSDGVFEINEQRFDTLDCIILGLIKQRIMWDDEVRDDDVPQCKSPDFEHGFPNMRPEVPARLQFPWKKSNFDSSAARPIHTPEYDSNGHPVLPCANCIFQEWNKGDWKTPPCSEQHTYPLLYPVGQGTEDEDWLPALFTVQRSAIQNSRKYLNLFGPTNKPMFTVHTRITLDHRSRGTNKFAVPVFKKGEATPREDWPSFGGHMRQIRNFVRQAPRAWQRDDEDESTLEASAPEETAPATTGDDPWSSSPKSPSKPAAAVAAAPATADEPVAADDDNDLPF